MASRPAELHRVVLLKGPHDEPVEHPVMPLSTRRTIGQAR
jgi:hypothetical protein